MGRLRNTLAAVAVGAALTAPPHRQPSGTRRCGGAERRRAGTDPACEPDGNERSTAGGRRHAGRSACGAGKARKQRRDLGRSGARTRTE